MMKAESAAMKMATPKPTPTPMPIPCERAADTSDCDAALAAPLADKGEREEVGVLEELDVGALVNVVE